VDVVPSCWISPAGDNPIIILLSKSHRPSLPS
jgi:hypothetical protein